MNPSTISSLLSPVERALRDSLQPPDSVQIDHPLPIFAVGSILKDTEHFSKLLTSGFAEASTDGQNTIRQCAYESEYDYPSDSDLDEFEELEETRTPVATSSSSKGKLKEESTDAPETPTGRHESDEKFHQVLIPSVAHRTLLACVFYLYTDKINFLPLRSKGRTERQFALLTTSDTLAPPCSPKSIYRLAEAYGITKLQDLAYDEIISQLNPRNVVPEAFSSFFARYDRLREHAVSYLSQNYSDPAVQAALPNLIDRFALGDLPHAGGVLRSLLGLRIALDFLSHAPLVDHMAPEASLTPPLTAVEKALRDSLLVPTFRDVRLYAFSQRTILPDGTLRIDHPLPVVTISSILKNTECFSKLLAAPGAVQQYASDSSEYDYESDSDLDEFEELQAEDVDVCPAGAGPSSADKLKVRGSTDRENDEDAVNTSPAAAMKNYIEVSVPNIAYRTLRACVFYLYTGKINFLPLTSSGAVERQLVMFTTSNDLAPPCSSKSVYRLAELYGLTELQELAYNKIISQLGQENILEEMFSSFFVRYDRLREYAVSYLSQNYYKPAVQQSLPDIIQRMALGEMPHASGVLRSLLGLPVAISSPATGRLVSHSRVIKPSHLRISEPTPPSPCAIDRQSIFKPHVPSQPVVRGTSLNIASNPVPPTKPSSSTASAYTPSSSSIGPGAAVRDLVHEKALSATSEAGPAETTVAGPGVAGDVGEPTEAQAPDNVPVVQLIAPGVGPFDDSAPVDETSIERSSKTTKKKRLKKKRISDREGTPTRQITSATPASPVPLDAPRLLSSHLHNRCIWPPGYGPDRGPGDADEDAVVNTTPSEPVRTFLP